MVQILNEGRLLRIQDAQVADTGRYTCIAVNVAGQADRKYDVNVHGEKNSQSLYSFSEPTVSSYRGFFLLFSISTGLSNFLVIHSYYFIILLILYLIVIIFLKYLVHYGFFVQQGEKPKQKMLLFLWNSGLPNKLLFL